MGDCAVKHGHFPNNHHASPYIRRLLVLAARCIWSVFDSGHIIKGRDGGETQRQKFVAGVVTVQIVRMNVAVIQHRARQTGLGYTMFLYEPLLWHPTTRQMAFTLPTTQKHAVLPN